MYGLIINAPVRYVCRRMYGVSVKQIVILAILLSLKLESSSISLIQLRICFETFQSVS